MTNGVDRPWIRQAILGFAVVAPFWTILFWRINVWLALATLFASHLLLLYPTLVSQSQWWGPVMRSFLTSRREVWLTIDDGPSEAHTRQMLDLLDRFQARATFFVIGRRAARRPDLLQEILARGHQIANHTCSHPSGSFWCAAAARVAREIEEGASIVPAQEGAIRGLFRAPAGLKNFFVHPVLARRGSLLIGWTVRGFDTVRRAPEKVAARILKHAAPGAIILLHEAHHLGDDPGYNPRCVELTLRGLAERGFECVIPRPEQLRAGLGGN